MFGYLVQRKLPRRRGSSQLGSFPPFLEDQNWRWRNTTKNKQRRIRLWRSKPAESAQLSKFATWSQADLEPVQRLQNWPKCVRYLQRILNFIHFRAHWYQKFCLMQAYPFTVSGKRKSITSALAGILSRLAMTMSAWPEISSPTIPVHGPSSWAVPQCLSGETDHLHLPQMFVKL